jgi:hypothetical protein
MRHRGTEILDRIAARTARVGRVVAQLERRQQSIEERLQDMRCVYGELLAVADEMNRRRLRQSG